MKCIITTTRIIKTKNGEEKVKSYYIGSPFSFLGMSIPEFSGNKEKAIIFNTKKEALQIAKTIGSLSIVGVNPNIKQNKRIEQATAKKLSLV